MSPSHYFKIAPFALGMMSLSALASGPTIIREGNFEITTTSAMMPIIDGATVPGYQVLVKHHGVAVAEFGGIELTATKPKGAGVKSDAYSIVKGIVATIRAAALDPIQVSQSKSDEPIFVRTTDGKAVAEWQTGGNFSDFGSLGGRLAGIQAIALRASRNNLRRSYFESSLKACTEKLNSISETLSSSGPVEAGLANIRQILDKVKRSVTGAVADGIDAEGMIVTTVPVYQLTGNYFTTDANSKIQNELTEAANRQKKPTKKWHSPPYRKMNAKGD